MNHKVVQRFLCEERGQTITEYVLALSVVVIAMVAATVAFADNNGMFHRTMRQLSRNVETLVAEPPENVRDLGP